MYGNIAVEVHKGVAIGGNKRSILASIERTATYWYENLYIVTLVAYGSWILLGTLFYHYVDKWTFATSLFYSLEVGLSVGFCAPVRAQKKFMTS